MKLLKLAILFLSLAFPKLFLFGNEQSCSHSEEQMKMYQSRQNEIKESEEEDAKTRRQIEIERDKLVAEVLMHKGVQALIEKFENTLKNIKIEENGNEIDLASLLDSSDEGYNKFASLRNSIENHQQAVGDVELLYNLLKNMGPGNVAGQDINSEFMSILQDAYESKTNLPAPAIGTQWEGDQIDALSGLGTEDIFNLVDRRCHDPEREFINFCPRYRELLSNGDVDQREEMVKGYLGLMVRFVKPKLEGSDTSTNNPHQVYMNQIKSVMPKYFQNPDGSESDSFQNSSAELNLIKQDLGIVQDNLETFKDAHQAWLTCQVQGNADCPRTVQINGAPVDISDGVNKLKQYTDSLESHSDSFKGNQRELQQIVRAAGAFSSDSSLSKFFGEGRPGTEAFKSLDPSADLSEIFKQTDHQCVMNLIDRFASEDPTLDKNSFVNNKISALLSSSAIGCELPENFDVFAAAGSDAKGPQNQALKACLMKLRKASSKQAIDGKIADLNSRIKGFDDQLAQIDESNAFQSLERLKKIEYNNYITNCTDIREKHDQKCSVQSTPLSDDQFQFFKVGVGDAVAYINITNDPERDPIDPSRNHLTIDESVEIHNLCSRKVNGEFISRDSSLCRRNSGRVVRHRDNIARVKTLDGYDKSYTTRTAPDGSKIYTKRLGLGYRLGYAALGTTQSWLRFGGRYYQNEAQMQYNTNTALYFTQMKAWSDQYSSRFQLGDLHSPARFSFSQQASLFRT